MSPRRTKSSRFTLAALALGAAICVAAIVAVLAGSEAGDDVDAGAGNPESELTAAEATAPLRDAPPALAALRADANRILGGGGAAFEARLESLRGFPVVVNKWASWCGPCRHEFPFFQSQAVEREEEVAFIGLDSNDQQPAAETFLRELPLPYPSYADPDMELAASFDAAREFPATIFIGADGEVTHVKLGGYGYEEDLAADIERYAR